MGGQLGHSRFEMFLKSFVFNNAPQLRLTLDIRWGQLQKARSWSAGGGIMWSYQLSGVNIDYSGLNSEIKQLAQHLVEEGVKPKPQDPYYRQWADWKAEQVFPTPGPPPPHPRPPLLDEATIGVWGILLFIGSLFAIGPLSASPAKYAGIIAGLVIFWICYLALWATARGLDNRYRKSVRSYWASYDPHHEHRPALSFSLEKQLAAELTDAWYEFNRPLATIPAAQVSAMPRAAVPWTPQGPHPSAKTACSDREAEFLARDWMLYLGEAGCVVSQATRDGGADVISEHFVAEVKHHASPVPPSMVQQIFGVAQAKRKTALFFALSGYSAKAIEFGNDVGMALFTYDFINGRLTPCSHAAEEALQQGLRRLSAS
jgi:hypothetical protein